MAFLYKRGRVWWVKFQHRTKIVRKSLQTGNRQLARDRARIMESSVKDGNFAVDTVVTRTPNSHALEEFCNHLRTTKTRKSAQTDIYYLRQLFGPACPAMLVNSRKPIGTKEYARRLAAIDPKDLRPRREHLQTLHVEDLTTADVSRFLTDRVRRRRLSPKTGNRLREVAHRFCQWCITQRNVRYRGNVNPVSAVERFRERAPTIRFLSLEQVQEQLKKLNQHPTMRAMVALLIYAGLRREELLWLTHADVDLKAGMIRVRAKTVTGVSWEPKTKRNRAVPISRVLSAILTEYDPPGESPWYFTSPKGCHWDPDNFSARLRKINMRCGLTWTCLDFRHTFGSHLAMRGESLAKISELLGNSPEICRRHYVSLVPERMRDVVEFDAPIVGNTIRHAAQAS